MRNDLRVLTVVVAYKSHDWLPPMLEGFRKHLSENELLVVDNDPDDPQPTPGWCRITANWSSDKSHGHGLDIGVHKARFWNFDFVLTLEPDCTITDDEWYHHLLHELRPKNLNGPGMTGMYERPYGPIHVCGSIWRVSHLRHSFKPIAKLPREGEGHYSLRAHHEHLADKGHDPETHLWLLNHWDVGELNWLRAAERHAAPPAVGSVNGAYGFTHHWRGSRRAPDPGEVPGFESEPAPPATGTPS